jgi:glycosyltransferase involved in cell wall biosynthesis
MTPANPPRVLVVSEIPTPYRLPVYAQIARRPELQLEVVFCSAEQPDRPWQIDAALVDVPHRVLPGRSVNLRGAGVTYEMNPAVVGLLRRGRYDLLVLGGYAMLTTQAAIAFAWATRTPYVLHSESHLRRRRPALLRAAKWATVGPVVRRAAGGFAVGSAAARYLRSYGMDPGRIRIVPNTIDVPAYRAAAEAARTRAAAIRAELGLPDSYVLYAGRLLELKGVRDLLEALALLGDDRPHLVVAGTGPLEPLLAGLPRVTALGFQPAERLIELLALAEWTVVPSHSESWGVVVNEALAAGSPVIVSDAVGAAEDLVVDRVNGRIVPARSPRALASALKEQRPEGDVSRGPIERWTYELAVEQFVEGVQLALQR